MAVSDSLAQTTSAASEQSIGQSGQKVNSKLLKEDSQGRSLTEAQREYFRDSKVVDEDGRLLPVYHATDETFTVFDRDKLGTLTDGNATDENWAATSHIGFWFNSAASRSAKSGRTTCVMNFAGSSCWGGPSR